MQAHISLFICYFWPISLKLSDTSGASFGSSWPRNVTLSKVNRTSSNMQNVLSARDIQLLFTFAALLRWWWCTSIWQCSQLANVYKLWKKRRVNEKPHSEDWDVWVCVVKRMVQNVTVDWILTRQTAAEAAAASEKGPASYTFCYYWLLKKHYYNICREGSFTLGMQVHIWEAIKNQVDEESRRCSSSSSFPT